MPRPGAARNGCVWKAACGEDTPLSLFFPERPMKISVVIPVRNEAGSIRALLDALLHQSLLPDEILITDGGSSDATPAIVLEYAQRNASVRLFRETMALPGRGRNVAAANASNEWLAFIDAGVVPATDWPLPTPTLPTVKTMTR
jgi:glycosyltransferase involved in cell wall biosynthesis